MSPTSRAGRLEWLILYFSPRPRPHRHAQKEVYYILSGEGKVVISGTEYVVGPRTAVFIPGGAEHCAVNTGSEPLRLLYVFPTDSFADVNYEFTSS